MPLGILLAFSGAHPMHAQPISERASAIDSDLLTAIISTQADIAAEVEVERVMAVVAARAQELTGAAGAIVEMVEGDDVVYGATSGTAEPHFGLRLRQANGLSGLCIRTGEVQRCDDAETDPRVDREACRLIGARSMLLVPLSDRDRVVGVLEVFAPQAHVFLEGAAQVLQLLAGFIGAALARATAFEASTRRAMYDGLTGVANRALLMDRMTHALALARRSGHNVGVAFIDLDGFKPINDQLGHDAGDAVLVEVARRLERTVRATDTVARLGGDEFVLVLPELERREALEVVVARARDALAEAMIVGGRRVCVGASIGRAFCGSATASADAALASADRAMYLDKRARQPRTRNERPRRQTWGWRPDSTG